MANNMDINDGRGAGPQVAASHDTTIATFDPVLSTKG
jgi:hypothetical protein